MCVKCSKHISEHKIAQLTSMRLEEEFVMVEHAEDGKVKSKLQHQAPSDLVPLIGQFVSISTSTRTKHEGFVDAIDPITGSVILSTSVRNVSNVVLIMGGEISEISLKDAPPEHRHESIETPKGTLDSADLELSKNKLHKWLLKNLLPVEEVNDALHVHNGNVVISPPYKPENCVSNNSIILGRIQHLLQNMPEESID